MINISFDPTMRPITIYESDIVSSDAIAVELPEDVDPIDIFDYRYLDGNWVYDGLFSKSVQKAKEDQAIKISTSNLQEIG